MDYSLPLETEKKGGQLMQPVIGRFKGTKGHISPLDLQLSCESPYYMAFSILKFYTSLYSRGQLSTLQEKIFKGNKC